MELAALNVAERAKLVERLCAVGAFRWSAVRSRAGGGSGGGVVIVIGRWGGCGRCLGDVIDKFACGSGS